MCEVIWWEYILIVCSVIGSSAAAFFAGLEHGQNKMLKTLRSKGDPVAETKAAIKFVEDACAVDPADENNRY